MGWNEDVRDALLELAAAISGGELAVSLSAPIEADIIDADMYEVTGTPPDSMDLYTLGTFGLGVGYGSGGGFLWHDGQSMSVADMLWSDAYMGGHVAYLVDCVFDELYNQGQYQLMDIAYATQNTDMNTYDTAQSCYDTSYQLYELLEYYSGGYYTDPFYEDYAGHSIAEMIRTIRGFDWGSGQYRGRTGFDAAGQDTYENVIQATGREYFNLSARCETQDAVLSLDGSTDQITVCAGDPPVVVRGVYIPQNTWIKAKNRTGGSNYANLAVNIW